MKDSLILLLFMVTALFSHRLEATTLNVDLAQNVGMLNHSTGWVRVRPQDPIIVACTSPCGQVEWGVIPSNAIQNITVLSRTDERCNSVTGTCINDFSEPCPAAENEFMKFTLKLRTTVTLIIQCNAYIIFATDLTTRHMMRGDSFLIMVENKEDILSPALQTATLSPTSSVNECVQTSSSVTTAPTSSHDSQPTSSKVSPSTSSMGLTFTSHAAVMSTPVLPAPTTMTPTTASAPVATAGIIVGNEVTAMSQTETTVTLCSFNSYLIVTVALGGLLVLTIMILIVTCMCFKCSNQRQKTDDQQSVPEPVSLSHATYSITNENRTFSSRDFDILEYSDPSDLPASTTV